jgi:hypothetical protein
MIKEGFCTAAFNSSAAKSEATSENKQENFAEKKRVSSFDMDMSYTRVLHIKIAYRVPHK